MPRRRAQHLPDNLPPRLLTRAQAAEYCSLSGPDFDALCPVPPLPLPGERFDVRKLDQWLDSLDPDSPSSTADPLMSALEGR